MNTDLNRIVIYSLRISVMQTIIFNAYGNMKILFYPLYVLYTSAAIDLFIQLNFSYEIPRYRPV